MATLDIVSWNIACIPSYINTFSPPKDRIQEIIKLLKSSSADIICLQ